MLSSGEHPMRSSYEGKTAISVWAGKADRMVKSASMLTDSPHPKKLGIRGLVTLTKIS